MTIAVWISKACAYQTPSPCFAARGMVAGARVRANFGFIKTTPSAISSLQQQQHPRQRAFPKQAHATSDNQTRDIHRLAPAKMAKDDASDLSSLSSLSPPPPSDSEPEEETMEQKKGILKFFSKAPKGEMTGPSKEDSPPRKREPSPPHEYVFADNPDIAVRRPCSFRALSAPTRAVASTTSYALCANPPPSLLSCSGTDSTMHSPDRARRLALKSSNLILRNRCQVAALRASSARS